MANNVMLEKLTELVDRANSARSAVHVVAIALDRGDTDLELHSAEVLKEAAEAIDMVSDELVSLRNAAKPRRRLTGKAAMILSADPA
jgi:hypothetical protein